MSRSGEAANRQALLYARDLARLNALRRAYERLLPAGLDPAAPAPPEARVVRATVLFTDLRGFSALAERLVTDPDALLSLMNEHFTVVVRAITRCGGTVEKYMGDGVFATFGARENLPDHPSRALAAAMAVVGANEALNRRRPAERRFRLEVAVGLALGTLVVGAVGPPERQELGVLGDAVNIAARLVSQAGPGELLIEENVYGGLDQRVQADLLGRELLRGRVSEVDVYRIALLRG